MEENIIKEELSKIKKLTPELKKRRNRIMIKNIIITSLIIIYLAILIFAFYKMELNSLSFYLKIACFIILGFSIYKFEQGYKKDNESIFLTGVEFLIIALFTLFVTDFINYDDYIFKNIIIGAGFFTIIYYLIKTIFLIRKIKKEHKKNINDIREIIKKGDKKNA